MGWIIGKKNSNYRLWEDNWLPGQLILSNIGEIPKNLTFTRNYLLQQFITDGAWLVPNYFNQELPEVTKLICDVDISESSFDEPVWMESTNGYLTVKQAWNCYRVKEETAI